MAFLEGEIVILNEKAKNGIPNRIGERGVINIYDFNSSHYEYVLEFDDKLVSPVKESEINRLTEEDKQYMEYIFTGNQVIHAPTNQEVKIIKVDYIHRTAEVDFISGGSEVIDFITIKPLEKENEEMGQPEIEPLGKFTEIGFGIGQFTDEKNKQYGSSVDATYEMIKVLMERYKNEDDTTYTIPESLIQHILLQVRMMDKINRVFNNPSGEGDSESPYRDLAGYSLIGIDMVEGK